MVAGIRVTPLILLLLFSTISHGKDNPEVARKKTASKQIAKKKKKRTARQRPPKPEKTIESRILKAGDAVQKAVEKTAERTDLMIAGKRYTKKKNKSSITYRQFVTWQDGRGVKFPGDFGFNLKLPNLEKRWQLRFSSYDEEADRRNLQEQRVRTTAPPKDYGAGLFFFEKLGNVKTSFQPRLQLSNPLTMSYTLRFENEAEVKPLKLNSRVELFADPKKGTGEYASLEFRFRLTERTELGFQNTEEYHERDNYFVTQHGLSLDHSLTPTRAVGTSFIAACNNKTQYHLDQYTYSWVVVQQVYPERLQLSLTPFLAFYKAAGFQGKTGITLQGNLTF
jgi:hypothetical protein